MSKKKKAAEVKEEPVEEEVVEEEVNVFDPTCSNCQKPMYSGHAVKCSICGEILHQFCFDRHVLINHRPEATVVKVKTESIFSQDGKYVGAKGTWEEVTNV